MKKIKRIFKKGWKITTTMMIKSDTGSRFTFSPVIGKAFFHVSKKTFHFLEFDSPGFFRILFILYFN